MAKSSGSSSKVVISYEKPGTCDYKYVSASLKLWDLIKKQISKYVSTSLVKEHYVT